jgi:hypothetical protein
MFGGVAVTGGAWEGFSFALGATEDEATSALAMMNGSGPPWQHHRMSGVERATSFLSEMSTRLTARAT